ncbi:FAD:protein FMN transferase, partial [Hydrogenibacillus schlegelii]|uniref:FAD:protein FMN transferase n=1 Tax=Hydrogenibacillus schlegelii TaxID=1484 RepID=UPI0034A06E46
MGPSAGRRRRGAPVGAAAARRPPPRYPARRRRTQRRRKVAVDLGGIAKGWVGREVAFRLRRAGVRLGARSAGGDLGLWHDAADIPRTVAHAPPAAFDGDPPPGPVRLTRGAAATTGVPPRPWTAHGPTHHLRDPSPGRPAESDVLPATVVAAAPLEAAAL